MIRICVPALSPWERVAEGRVRGPVSQGFTLGYVISALRARTVGAVRPSASLGTSKPPLPPRNL